MLKSVLVVIVIACTSTLARAQSQITVPLSLEDQARIIPMLCERALFGYRAELQLPCDQIKAKLTQALADEQKAKAGAVAEKSAAPAKPEVKPGD